MAEVIKKSSITTSTTVVLNENEMLAFASISGFSMTSVVDAILSNITSQLKPHRTHMISALETLTSASRIGIREVDEARTFLREKHHK